MSFFRLSSFILLVLLIGIVDANPAQECAGKFLELRFAYLEFARYSEFFDESSTMTLANTGIYRGPDAIEEYG